MPYLQLDLPHAVDAAVRIELARRLVAVYAELMETQVRIVNVGFRTLAGGPMRFEGTLAEPPTPVVLVACDIRRGRSAAHLERLAERIVAIVADGLRLPPLRVVVEFTQHAGAEMYRYGAVAPDWDPAESAG